MINLQDKQLHANKYLVQKLEEELHMKKMMDKKQKEMPINTLQFEIEAQDLDGKSGAGMFTAIQLTLAKKCGGYFTASYECTSNNISCG
jgi:hypothetical protein